jgi:PhnB protein
LSTAPAARARIRRHFRAQAEDVFDAWIDPAKIRHWFGPGLGELGQIDIDPRVGGRFTIVQRRAHGDATHTGEYLELERPRRLAFTWSTPPQADQSRVHIEIGAVADGCELSLTHDMEARWAPHVERIEHGWSTQMDALATLLEQRADPMSTYRTVTPYLVVPDADAELAFLAKAFAARETLCHRCPDGTVQHAELQIGDSLVMVGQAGGSIDPRPAAIYLWVEDVDATYERAVAAGATPESAPTDKPYGHRTGGVVDANGVTWWISSPMAAVHRGAR